MTDAAPPNERPVRVGVILAIALTVLLLVRFGRAAWGGWWIADTTETGDTYMLATIYERWAVQVKDGHLPLWFPEFAGGYPVHAAWMYGLAYPPIALFLVLPPEAAWTWLAVLHIVFGAIGMYAFAWDNRRDAIAAASGAIVFALSGFALGRVASGHLNLLMPFAWTPWVLRAAMRAVRGERGAVETLGVCAGLGLLAGHVQVWFLAAPLVAAYAAFEMTRAKSWRSAMPRLAGGVAIALGIAAVQWLPAWEMFTVSGHPPEHEKLVLACSAPASALAAQVAPRFAPSDPGFGHEFVGLAGPLAVGAALLAFKLRDSRRWFWLGVLAFGLVLATGLTNDLGRLANELPPFRFARSPGRALLLVVIAGGVLAAELVADHRAMLGGKLRRFVPVAFAASALVWGPAAPDVVTTDFYEADASGPLGPRTTSPSDARRHRFHVQGARWPYLERVGLRTMRDVCPIDIPGYRALTDPVTPAKVTARWFDVAAALNVPWDHGPPADLAATVAALDRTQVRTFGQPRDDPFDTRDNPREVHVFRDAEVADDAETIRRLRAGENVLLIAAGQDVPSFEPGVASNELIAVGFRYPSPSEIELRVDLAPWRWALLSAKWYPGWVQVAKDGGRTPVLRANAALIAVPLPAGRSSTITLRYEPGWLPTAIALSAAGWIAANVLIRRTRRRVRDLPASG